MTEPAIHPTAIVVGLVTGSVASIFGTDGPTTAFLVTLGIFALAGAWARLFYDATTGSYSVRRQLGFVGLSVMTAFVTTFLLWDAGGLEYPTVLMGVSTFMALIGPADALRFVRRLVLQMVRLPDDAEGSEDR